MPTKQSPAAPSHVMNKRTAYSYGLAPKPRTAAEGLEVFKPAAQAKASPAKPKPAAAARTASTQKPAASGATFAHLNEGAAQRLVAAARALHAKPAKAAEADRANTAEAVAFILNAGRRNR
ncbi:hypothetical protein [Roseomonas sp. BN140053]|uniref:hypothetical protein n=1 Tax=Roseomonas sp. BN140053 TaxID=3391898 RepID=UPI0039EBC3B0